MDRPQFEVADVFRCYGADYRLQNGASMSNAQHRVMTAIEVLFSATAETLLTIAADPKHLGVKIGFSP
jgi:hypothetical protein